MFARVGVVVSLLALAVAWAARGSRGAGREQVSIVRPGDTLWAIATVRYAGDPRAAIWRLSRRNRLASPLLRPGQRLVLP